MEEDDVDLRRSLRSLLYDGIASQTMFSLLTISIVTSYLASRNVSPILIGLVAALPYLSQIVQVPSTLFAEKVSRKKVSIYSSFISRMSLLAIAVLTLNSSEVTLFILFFAIYNVFKELSTVPWSSWMRDLIPNEIRGSYYSMRLAYGKFLALFVVLTFTALFNVFGNSTFPVLFLTAFLAGIVSLWFISKIDDVAVKERRRKSLRQPLKDGNFLRFVSAVSLWKFATEMALPFYSVYIISILNYPVWIVVALAALSQLSSAYFLRVSGGIMDKFGNKPVMALSFAAFSAAAIMFTFTTMPEKHVFTLPLLVLIYILDGFYSSIPPLAVMNTIAKITPRNNSASYYAFCNVVSSTFGASGSIFGGILATLMLSANFAVKIDIDSSIGFLEIPAIHLSSYDFLFLIAAVISLISAKMLKLFSEENARSEEDVSREIRRAVLRDFQLIAMHFPFPIYLAKKTRQANKFEVRK